MSNKNYPRFLKAPDKERPSRPRLNKEMRCLRKRWNVEKNKVITTVLREVIGRLSPQNKPRLKGAILHYFPLSWSDHFGRQIGPKRLA